MNKIKTTSIIAAFTLTLATSAFAGTSSHEQNRQITRGSGLVDSNATELVTVYGSKATAHTISRHARTASQQKALTQEVKSTMANSAAKNVTREVTAFRNNRNS